MTILLGGLTLDGFEAAAQVRFGGSQALAVHKLPGGVRIIDAMGADDDVIAWHGILSGFDASDRARALDAMRSSGTPVSMAWDVFAAEVIVSSLALNFQNSWWIPYHIRCTVLSQLPSAGVGAAAAVLSDVLADLTSVSGPGVAAALAAVSSVGSSGPGTQGYAAAQIALNAAQTGISAAVTGTGAAVLNAPDIATLTSCSGSLAALTNAAGFVGRAMTNFSGAVG